jgi:hypothetical protein
MIASAGPAAFRDHAHHRRSAMAKGQMRSNKEKKKPKQDKNKDKKGAPAPSPFAAGQNAPGKK